MASVSRVTGVTGLLKFFDDPSLAGAGVLFRS